MWPFSSLNGDKSRAKATTEKKRAERERLISVAPSFISDHEQFVNAGASEIVARIENGEWTASRVVEAYIAQAAKAHLKTNCVTEVLFEQALKRAAELDAEFAVTKKLRGPFHGVPFSLKDQFDVAGFDSSIGFTAWANKPAVSDAVVVRQLKSLGGIPIVKTNVPQTMFSFECNNPLWGRTINPHNSKYTCGGSSGGEAAILAMNGAALGVGSDIGGSLRIPSSYCGIYALKTSSGRISKAGATNSNPGYEGIRAVIGPMARNVKDLELFCRAIFGIEDSTELDYNFVPLPYREPVLPKQLKFGYYTSDGFVQASPANRRAVMEAVEALRREGHECIEIELPDVSDCMEIFLALSSSDGYKRLTKPIGPDSMDPSLFLPILGARVPGLLRKLATWIVETILGDTSFAKFIRVSRTKSVSELIEWTQKRNEWNAMFYEKVWNRYNLDGIICPVQAMPQTRHGDAATTNVIAIATILYNVVDSPIGNVPVTHVDARKDQLTKEWTSPSSISRSALIEKRLYQGAEPIYNPDELDGMPVSIQVIGRKWEDEKVIAMMSIVDTALGSNEGGGPRESEGHVDS